MELFGMEFTPAQLFLAALEVVAIVLLIAVLFRKERTGETAADSPGAPVRTAGAAGEEEDEGELIAVITAAVAAAMGKPAEKIKVTDIKRVPSSVKRTVNRNAWGRQGKIDQVRRYI